MANSGSDSVNRFGRVLSCALAELESRQREIDDLNVFPVADGDTGRNMVMTLRGLVSALDALKGSIGPVDLQEVDRDLVVKAVARAALSSAHGNSGVILSQLIRGAAKELGSGQGRKVSPHLLGRAMRGAAEQGIASIPEPREGTILTVARDIADALEAAYPNAVSISDDIPHQEQDALLAGALEIAVAAGTASVDRGPELLDVLREKGVVDAGGYGLVVLIAGALAALRGEASSDLPHRRPAGERIQQEPLEERYSHCVNFTVLGSGLDAKAEAARLSEAGIGDSILVVGDSELIRVHVHTDDPTQARAMFEPLGTIDGFVEEDMNEQIRLRDERLGGEADTSLLLIGHDAAAAELFELERFGFLSLSDNSELHADEVTRAARQVEGEGLVIIATSETSLAAAARALATGAVAAELVNADHLGAALLALSAVEGWDPSHSPAVNSHRISKSLEALSTAAVRLGDRSAGDQSDVVVMLGADAWTAETVEGAIAFAAASFEPGAFVTAVVDPGFDGGEAAVQAAFDEVDVSTAALGGWVCVLASEA